MLKRLKENYSDVGPSDQLNHICETTRPAETTTGIVHISVKVCNKPRLALKIHQAIGVLRNISGVTTS